jgi:hypothetical protein
MSSISIKAVLIAALFDVVTSSVLGVVVVSACAAWSGAESADDMARFASSNSTQFLTYAVGSVVSVIAGYMAAAIARRGELINGALSSFLCVLLGIYVELAGISAAPAALSITSLALSPLLGLLGGYLRLRQVARAA